MDNLKILGVPFSKKNMKETVDVIAERISSDKKELFNIITGNPEIVLRFKDDAELQRVIHEADLITPDGIGIVIASKWKGKPLRERVTGFDLLAEALKKGNELGWSFYFLGTDEDTNKKAVEVIKNTYPNVVVAGRHNGYFNSEEEGDIIKEIQTVKPDILIVALGAPRAEKWIYNHKELLPAKVAFGVGGSLDGIAGKVPRSPEIWIKLNIEWMYRLIKQPSRWRRQIILPVFASKALGEAIKERFRSER